MKSRIAVLTLAAGALWLSSVTEVYAELVFLASGRTLSVRGHRIEGESIILLLRNGGEVTCDRSLIARIEPDEVPYPDPPEPREVRQESLKSIPYGEIIDAVATEHGVDSALVRAVIQVESGYRSRARSRKGAIGLMQLMPATARLYSARDPYDPRSNIEAGIKHLKSLLDKFELSIALAAYNAGETAVRKFGGIPPYRETRTYVSRILKLARLGPAK